MCVCVCVIFLGASLSSNVAVHIFRRFDLYLSVLCQMENISSPDNSHSFLVIGNPQRPIYVIYNPHLFFLISEYERYSFLPWMPIAEMRYQTSTMRTYNTVPASKLNDCHLGLVFFIDWILFYSPLFYYTIHKCWPDCFLLSVVCFSSKCFLIPSERLLGFSMDMFLVYGSIGKLRSVRSNKFEKKKSISRKH